MLFALPEYDSAFADFLGRTVREMARARDPVLAEIPFEETSTTPSTRIQDRAGMDLDLPAASVGFEFSTSVSNVRNGEFSALALEIDKAADQFAEGLVKHWVATMDAVTAATGNVVDAGGNLTFEKFYELLDTMEWTVDDDDNLVMPTLVMHPDTVKSLPEETDETRARMDELLAKKRQEAIARRRRRRLS